VVTEVTPQLADHGGDREGREGCSVFGIEAFDRLEHPEHRDLLEIVERLVAVGEAAGERACELEIVLDERVAQATIAGPPVLTEPFDGGVVVDALDRLDSHGVSPASA
jgi:hypothetical protein